jgi:meso-butanediol dehydrogenase/(S,S)-butanediol dehydrogenase/diacetyl reductase
MATDVLTGRSAVVVGGAGAIGQGIVAELTDAGARVLIADLEGERLTRTADELGAGAHPVDITDPASVAALADGANEQLGSVDVLVNAAGVLTVGTVVDTSPEEWDRVMAVNAGGVYLASRAFLPRMIEAGSGAIISISSINGKQGMAELSAYSASKFAVVGFTQSLAYEVGQHGITVNAICPGVVQTPMLDDLLAESGRSVEDELRELQIIQRTQTPRELGAAVVFLAAMPSITGQAVNVDGGCVFH